VLPDGELVIFEINACVQVTGTIPEQYRPQIGYIEDNNDEVLDALLQRVRSRAAAGRAPGGLRARRLSGRGARPSAARPAARGRA